MQLYTRVLWVFFVAGLLYVERIPAAEPPPQIQQEVPVLKLSLKDAIEAALDKNPNVRLYKERIEAVRAAVATLR